MFSYRYDSSESSDGETHDHDQFANPIRTLDFSESSLSTRHAAEQFENASECGPGQKRKEAVETLLVTHNALDALPTNVSRFRNLRKLDVSNNRLATLPDAILRLPLATLIAKNNQLTQNGLPESFENFTALKVCNFSGNNFSKFPPQLLDVRSMEYLYMGGNRIVELPKEIELMRKLKVLCMGGNYLTEIPHTLGNLTNLRGLILSDNALEILPASIANLKNLKSLLLHKNRLRTLPTEIVALKCLTELSLRENPLVVSFVNDMLHNPPSLLELVARAVKLYDMEIPEGELPVTLREYLKSAHRCVNPKCKGVFFDNRVEHIKFVDFCGKYRIPLLQYLCSSKCVANNSTVHGPYADSTMLRKVLLG